MLESDLLAQVSADRLWETNREIAQWVRLLRNRNAVDFALRQALAVLV